MRVRNHFSNGVSEENTVCLDRSAEIYVGIEFWKSLNYFIERYRQAFVENDAETSFFVVVDEEDDRASEIKIIHKRFRY